MQLFLPSFLAKVLSQRKDHIFDCKTIWRGKNWGSSFVSASWSGGKGSAGQAWPWPVLAVGHTVPAVGTCRWPEGQFIAKGLLLPEPSLLKLSISLSLYLSARVARSRFVLARDLLVTRCDWNAEMGCVGGRDGITAPTGPWCASDQPRASAWCLSSERETRLTCELLNWTGRDCSGTRFGNVGSSMSLILPKANWWKFWFLKTGRWWFPDSLNNLLKNSLSPVLGRQQQKTGGVKGKSKKTLILFFLTKNFYQNEKFL